jgi:hypothetical protein
MTPADPRDGLQGLVAKWCKPDYYREFDARDCATELQQFLAHARPEAVDEAMVERACIAYYEQPAWAFMSHKAACKDRMRAALVTALTPDQSP